MSGPRELLRVLIVDDMPQICEALETLLEMHDDLEVVGTASDGAEAVSLTMRLEPDVVVMDLRMPRLDGLQATCQLRTSLPATGVIMHSAYADESLIEEARRSGARAFAVKGSHSRKLNDLIHRVAASKPGDWISDDTLIPLPAAPPRFANGA